MSEENSAQNWDPNEETPQSALVGKSRSPKKTSGGSRATKMQGSRARGRTRTEPIENLDEAIACEQAAIENGDKPLSPNEQATLFEELGINPEEVRGDPIVPPWERSDRDRDNE